MKLLIRILGALVGLAFVLTFPLMIKINGVNLSNISGLIIGIVFLVYGIGSDKALSKILPSYRDRTNGK